MNPIGNNVEIRRVFFELFKPIHFKVINIFGPEAHSDWLRNKYISTSSKQQTAIEIILYFYINKNSMCVDEIK